MNEFGLALVLQCTGAVVMLTHGDLNGFGLARRCDANTWPLAMCQHRNGSSTGHVSASQQGHVSTLQRLQCTGALEPNRSLFEYKEKL